MDEYEHHDCRIIYTSENIPGPKEDSTEYEDIMLRFSNQLQVFCNCEETCLCPNCNCVNASGLENYILNPQNQQYILNEMKLTGTNSYPIIECNTECLCPLSCTNRFVQKGPIKCLEVKICENRQKGLGLYTNAFIYKGQFVCEYAGEVITKSQAIDRQNKNEAEGRMNYIFCLNEFSGDNRNQTIIDPSLFGNIGRYINHSCHPNCVVIPVRVHNLVPKLSIFSFMDIPPNAEITFDYGSQDKALSKMIGKKKCLCGAFECRNFMPYQSY